MINNFGDNDNYGAGYGYGSYGEQPAAPVQEPLANNLSGVAKIKVIGVGGAGNNAVNRLIESGLKSAEYIVATGCTVRACSAHFNISKSTVHKDVSERLKNIDMDLYERARAVSERNLNERHIRGGIATKQKYLKNEKTEEK